MDSTYYCSDAFIYNGYYYCALDEVSCTNGCANNQCTQPSCTSGSRQCLTSTTYRTCSSSGQWGSSQNCPSGYTCTGSGTCTAPCDQKASYKCYQNDVWYYDCNGGRTTLKDDCSSGETCNVNKCEGICQSHDTVKCYDNDAYYYDSCGSKEELKEDCGANSCDNGICKQCIGSEKVCETATSLKICKTDGSGWTSQACGTGQICRNAECITAPQCTNDDSCNDNNDCTIDICSASETCINTPISGCGNTTDCKAYQEEKTDGTCKFSFSKLFTGSGFSAYWQDSPEVIIGVVLAIILVIVIIVWLLRRQQSSNVFP
jgi:hypothetical protein